MQHRRSTHALLAVAILLLIISFTYVLYGRAKADTKTPIVYITRTGECYHRGSCSSLRHSKIPIRRAAAIRKHYRRCSKCYSILGNIMPDPLEDLRNIVPDPIVNPISDPI